MAAKHRPRITVERLDGLIVVTTKRDATDEEWDATVTPILGEREVLDFDIEVTGTSIVYTLHLSSEEVSGDDNAS